MLIDVRCNDTLIVSVTAAQHVGIKHFYRNTFSKMT